MEERRISGLLGLDTLQLRGKATVVSVSSARLRPTRGGPLRGRHIRLPPMPSVSLREPARTAPLPSVTACSIDSGEAGRLSEYVRTLPGEAKGNALADLRAADPCGRRSRRAFNSALAVQPGRFSRVARQADPVLMLLSDP